MAASKIISGLELEPAQVEEVARGRVWSGADAVKSGLVDRLGGYQVAFDELRQLLGVSSTTPLKLKRFPARKGIWSRLMGRGSGDDPRPLAPEAAALLGISVRSLQYKIKSYKLT